MIIKQIKAGGLVKRLTIASVFCVLAFFATKLAGQSNASFIFQGLERFFLVYSPDTMYSEKGFPLVVALHGFTQNERRIMNYSGFNDLADQNGFMVVYPRGIQASWNFGISHNEVNDPLFLNALLDTLIASYPVDTGRIYFAGFSNGGFMSYEMACHFSHRVAAIASVTGSMSNNQNRRCNPEFPVGIMQIHGTADNVINYNGQSWVMPIEEVVDYWILENGCTALPDTSYIHNKESNLISVKKLNYGPCEDQVSIELWKVLEGGHTWPGASARSGSGRTNRDIIASEKIWNFFIRHKRDNAVVKANN